MLWDTVRILYALSVNCKNRTTAIFSVYSKNNYKMKYYALFLAYIILLLFIEWAYENWEKLKLFCLFLPVSFAAIPFQVILVSVSDHRNWQID